MSSAISPMLHRRISGKIIYTSSKPEFAGQQRGAEWFSFIHHEDGCTTMSAQCEIWHPEPKVLRHIIYSLDKNGRPADCHVRLTVDDAFMGSGWFRIGDSFIECESYGPTIGRLSQRVDINGNLDGFGTHPIVGDAYLTKCMDIARGPHKRRIVCFLPSPDHRGATPPQIARVEIDLEYIGVETITIAAGTFAARHFRFVDDHGTGMGGNQHPAYDMWVTADTDSLFLKGGVGGYMGTAYELVELSR
jgi:hypothetical protein